MTHNYSIQSFTMGRTRRGEGGTGAGGGVSWCTHNQELESNERVHPGIPVVGTAPTTPRLSLATSVNSV